MRIFTGKQAEITQCRWVKIGGVMRHICFAPDKTYVDAEEVEWK